MLRADEELLSKERAEWKEVCKKDNQRMYAARSKITNFEAQIAALKGKERLRTLKRTKGAELKAQVASKDKDLNAKDAKQRANEAQDISTSALNVAQNNYVEAQAIVYTLVSDSEWMRNRGVVVIANSILNASEMDTVVSMLIDVSRAVGHCGGYLECAHHVEEAFGQEFDTSHCFVIDQADAVFARAEEVYDHLSLPVMDLVTEALKHDDWCSRLKTIFDPQETVELTDEEEAAGGDGDGDGDGFE
ncbi:hypothetical protein Hanom_Chr10g00921941 [Helianthus anomalus]